MNWNYRRINGDDAGVSIVSIILLLALIEPSLVPEPILASSCSIQISQPSLLSAYSRDLAQARS